MLFARRPTVLTHDSKYHADDIFAVAALELLLGKITIVRTRDAAKIAAAEYVVDVGGIHNAAAKRFDHHQSGGAGKRDNGIPYASFGLVWKEYGTKLCGGDAIAAGYIDAKLASPLDAHDNGFNFFSLGETAAEPYEIWRVFQSTLPTWKEEMAGDEDYDSRFIENVALAKKILSREIIRARAKDEANAIVEGFFQKAADKRLLILDRNYPWSDVAESHTEILFVLFPKSATDWRLQAVQKEKGSFANRKNLPAAWGGKTDAELEAASGVKGARFCHNALFMAAASSEEAIRKLAEIALNS